MKNQPKISSKRLLRYLLKVSRIRTKTAIFKILLGLCNFMWPSIWRKNWDLKRRVLNGVA